MMSTGDASPARSEVQERRPTWLQAWWPTLMAMFVVEVLTTIHVPPHDLPDSLELPIGADKLGHFLGYLATGALVLRSLRLRTRQQRVWSGVPAAMALIAGYAAADELHQLLLPYRTCDWRDWLADVLGGACAVAVAVAWHTRVVLPGRGRGTNQQRHDGG